MILTVSFCALVRNFRSDLRPQEHTTGINRLKYLCVVVSLYPMPLALDKNGFCKNDLLGTIKFNMLI